MMTYNIFISHSWRYSDAYDGLIKLLETYPYANFRDFSVPKDDPIHTSGSDAVLYNAIKAKMQFCNIVIILAGVYSSYSKWIDKEIKIANIEFSQKKPIIGIAPWAQKNISTVVKENALDIVRWNTASIVEAIRKYSI